MDVVYEMVREDMTTLGAMGTSPTVDMRKLFTSMESAKAFAEEDYGDKIQWTLVGDTYASSGDLRYVMYCIYIRKLD